MFTNRWQLSPILRPSAGLGLLLATCLLPACIGYRSSSQAVSHDIPDVRVLKSIELGTTTTSWLLERLGEPIAVRHSAQDKAVWQYENLSSAVREVRALPVFALQMESQIRTVYNFQIENERVTRVWQERLH